jgi:hypothetical protein
MSNYYNLNNDRKTSIAVFKVGYVVLRLLGGTRTQRFKAKFVDDKQQGPDQLQRR